MAKAVKNQHYVPKMYIKRFSSNGKKVCVWKVKENEILTRQEPSKYAARRYFYDASAQELKEALAEMAELYPDAVGKVDLDDEQFLEKALSRVEGATASIMDAVCEDGAMLFDEANMVTLGLFLHELAYRSEKYRGMIVQMYQLMGLRPAYKTAKSLIENYNWYIGTVPGRMKLVISDNSFVCAEPITATHIISTNGRSNMLH